MPDESYSILQTLRQKNPKLAEALERWKQKYDRTFDFAKSEDQATFYEGMLEIARHIATTAEKATPCLWLMPYGVSSLEVQVEPKSQE